MILLQIVFVCSFLVGNYAAFVMWRLDRDRQIPGARWWVAGSIAMSMTALMSVISVYWGEWARGFVAHVFMISAFCMFWVGARQYTGHAVRSFNYAILVILAVVSGCGVFWFWIVDPNPQVRLTINSVVLLLLSMRIAQTFFLSRIEFRTVTASGLLYLAFAFINGFRCIDIILFPALGTAFGSNIVAIVLTFMLVCILLAILISHILMIREFDPVSLVTED